MDKLKQLKDLTEEEVIKEIEIRDNLIQVLTKANEKVERLLKTTGVFIIEGCNKYYNHHSRRGKLKANETAERLLKLKSLQKEKILIGNEVTND